MSASPFSIYSMASSDAYPVPPHCPYNGEPVPLVAVEVATVDIEVVVEDFRLVVSVVEIAFDVKAVDVAFVDEAEDEAVVGLEPPAPQTNGVGPGIVYVVKVW